MKISYNWLKQFIKTDLPAEEVSDLLTDLGLEVESITKYEAIKGSLSGVVVGEVITCIPHPDADRLKLTTVNLGGDTPVQIVCGAPNVAVGQKVPVATIGTVLYDKDGNETIIKKGKIRGQDSFGMICAEDELGIGTSHDGIMVLPSKYIAGKPVSEYMNMESDEVFEIGLTPNRADAMSHYGTARDLRAGLLQKGKTLELKTPSVTQFKVDKRNLKIDVEVINKDLAPRYCGITITGITVKESPAWLQNRLKSLGLNPKNNVIDATNYVLHDLGQPLHAFDAADISGKIIVKTMPKGTKFVTLDDVERTLHEEDLMVCDEKEPLCMAGVFGGKKSGIKDTTTSVFIESAYFNPISIRKTAKRHQLSTDASFRFERGIDPSITEYALKRAVLLIQEMAGGEVSSDIIDVYDKKIEGTNVFLHFNNLIKTIGKTIDTDTIIRILGSLDIKVNNISDNGLGLTIPAYRVDVLREIDVIEEILRVYGYNNVQFSNKITATVANSPRTEDYKIQNIIATQLNSQGFYEIMSNSLTTDYSLVCDDIKKDKNVDILNPLSTDLATLRQSLLFSGLEAIAYNLNRQNTDLKFFEFGKTYHKLPNAHQENKHLSLFLTGNRHVENWTNPNTPSDFFLFKGYVQSILERLGITGTAHSPIKSSLFSEGIALGNENIVELGVVKKSILKHFGIKQEVFYADFDWNNILNNISPSKKYSEISKYPEVRRDLALLIDSNITYLELYNLAKQTEKVLLKEINLFDVYEGKNLEEGKKSYALSFIIQDDTKTLNNADIESIMNKLQQAFETKLGAKLR